MTAAEAAAIIVAAATLVSSVAGLVVAVRTGVKVEATKQLVNGHAEALHNLAGRASFAEGLVVGSTLPAEKLVDQIRDKAPD